MGKTRTLTPLQIVFLTSFGQGLEYYDFVLYGMMAGQLGTIFFPSVDQSTTLIQSFLLFAVGYFVRPFGGMIFGRIADRKGRKHAFPLIMFIMAFSTAAIGLLPSYQTAGGWAILGLALCRLLQGLSYGAELPNAATIVHEFSEKSQQGRMAAILLSSTSIGALSATFVLFLLNRFFSPAEITAGFWRIPFLFGGVLGVIAWFARRRLRETPAFNRALKDEAGAEMKKELAASPLNLSHLLCAIGVTLFLSNLVVTNIYMPTFIHQNYGTELQDIYRSMSVSMMATPFYMLFFGFLSDRVSRIKIMWATLISFLVLIGPLFQLLSINHSYALQFYFLAYQIWVSAFFVSYLPVLTEFFAINQRSTGLGISYNVAYSLASTFPALLNFLVQKNVTVNTPMMLFGNFILCTLVTLLSLRLVSGFASAISGNNLSLFRK